MNTNIEKKCYFNGWSIIFFLFKSFSLKERPISPPPGSVTSQQNQLSGASLPLTSLPSPLAGNDSPIQGSSQSSQNTVVQPGVGQTPVYRPPNAGKYFFNNNSHNFDFRMV